MFPVTFQSWDLVGDEFWLNIFSLRKDFLYIFPSKFLEYYS